MDLGDLERGFSTVLADLEPLQHAMGAAGKEVAFDVYREDLGSDMAFSGFRRKVPLRAGYDLGNPVMLNLYPEGLIGLASDGRKAKPYKVIPRRGRRRRRGGNRPAVSTPQGPRYSARITAWGGLGTYDTIAARCETAVPEAVGVEVERMLRQVF